MKTILRISVIAALIGLTGCTRVNTEPGQESVIIDKPMFVGQGGIRNETFKPGLNYTWFSSTAIPINTQPMLVEENFDDLMTSDTVPVDFRTSLQIQITDPIVLWSKYGNSWYKINVQRQYQALMRDEARKYSMNELLTGQETPKKMEANVRVQLDKMIADLKLPFRVTDLNIGRALPNDSVLQQINLTAAQQQRSKTMIEQEKAEQQRKKAEQARAAADNAYREEMQLSPDQFLQLESIKRYSEACAHGNTCNFMFGTNGNTSTLLPGAKK
jgi:regulator of protease activity HflC (stomatin/prohibitin superfamily)